MHKEYTRTTAVRRWRYKYIEYIPVCMYVCLSHVPQYPTETKKGAVGISNFKCMIEDRQLAVVN